MKKTEEFPYLDVLKNIKFHIEKNFKTHVAMCELKQFPLKLAWALTGNKLQIKLQCMDIKGFYQACTISCSQGHKILNKSMLRISQRLLRPMKNHWRRTKIQSTDPLYPSSNLANTFSRKNNRSLLCIRKYCIMIDDTNL